MRKQAEDNYLRSLSKYNFVFYWHFIMSSTIIIIVIYFSYKVLDVNTKSLDSEYSHFNREMIYEYFDYFLRVEELYDNGEISETEESVIIEPNKPNEAILENSSNQKVVETQELTNGNNNNVVESPSEIDNFNTDYNANSTNSIENVNNFVKTQDNLYNTIEKSEEIVYNNILKDGNPNSLNNSNGEIGVLNKDLVLNIVIDENINKDINKIVVSENTLITFKKLQLDYINNFYYNYMEKHYSNLNDNSERGLSIYQIILINKLLNDDKFNEDKFKEDKLNEAILSEDDIVHVDLESKE